MASNTIKIGNDTYTDSSIKSVDVLLHQSIEGSELHYDTATIVVDLGFTGVQAPNAEASLNRFAATGSLDPREYRFGTPVMIWHGSYLVGKFYITDLPKRIGRTRYEITCCSGAGLLDNYKHFGGLYTGETVREVLDSIIGGTFPYTIDEPIAKKPVRGWLPIATRRNNLHQVLFASGATIMKDTNGDIVIRALKETDYKIIPKNRVYMGGTVGYPHNATDILLTEHSYFPHSNNPVEVLYQDKAMGSQIVTPNGQSVDGSIIQFKEPCYELSVSGANLIESGANYAVVSSSSNVELRGKKYTHTTRVVSMISPEVNVVHNEDAVEDATLVTLQNSEGVLNRLFNYFNTSKEVQVDLNIEDEKPGAFIEFTDPFGETARGIIQEMDVTLSSTVKAQSTVIAGYVPGEEDVELNRVTTVTSSGQWQVPQDSKGKIIAVLIGGGQGASAGTDGEDTPTAIIRTYDERDSTYHPDTGDRWFTNHTSEISPDYAGKYAKGGKAGTPGAGGKILIVQIKVKPGQVFSVSIGTGGSGAPRGSSGMGSLGGATTFAGFSSENGTASPEGYYEQINGVLFASTGKAGHDGGHGSYWAKNPSGGFKPITANSITSQFGTHVPGGNLTEVKRAQMGSSIGSSGGKTYVAKCGGLGGGPAAGANGSTPSDFSVSAATTVYANRPGDGADARTPPRDSRIGYGGSAGNGGGGAGCYGIPTAVQNRHYDDVSGRSVVVKANDPASGGLGSPGGAGGNGGVIIYY